MAFLESWKYSNLLSVAGSIVHCLEVQAGDFKRAESGNQERDVHISLCGALYFFRFFEQLKWLSSVVLWSFFLTFQLRELGDWG